MAHAPGWIDLYEHLEDGREPPPDLVATCLENRNGLDENVLHWYAIEGAPAVLQRLVELGCDIDNINDCGSTPILDAARIARWDNVRVLRAAGARLDILTPSGSTYASVLTEHGDAVPEDLRGDAYSLADLLDPESPAGARILSLDLSRTGILEGAPGRELSAATWADYVAAHPDIEDHVFEFLAGEDGLDPTVTVLFPDLTARRIVYHVAHEFGARVAWWLTSPDDPGPVDS